MAFATPLGVALFALTGCSSKPKSPESPESAVSATVQQSSTTATPVATPQNLDTTDAGTAKQTAVLALPKDFIGSEEGPRTSQANGEIKLSSTLETPQGTPPDTGSLRRIALSQASA